MNRVQARSCELHLHHGKRTSEREHSVNSERMEGGESCMQIQKKKILESKRQAREDEVLEEGKKHKLGEVFQNSV